MATYTLTLTPDEEAALAARARALGWGGDPLRALGHLVRRQLRPAPAPPADEEASLRAEYHALVDVELAGAPTPAQAARLRAVEVALDALDARDPVEQAMDARARETSDSLDAVLRALRRRPVRPDPPRDEAPPP